MSDKKLSPWPRNASSRPVYQRRNRKGNRTTHKRPSPYLSLTSAILTTTTTTNSTLIANTVSVPINYLIGPLSYLTQYKYFFLIGLSLLIFLCVISILFLIIIFKCTRVKSRKKRRHDRLDIKRLEGLPDFLDDQQGNKDENQNEHTILLKQTTGTNPLINGSINTNGNIPNDNISNTLSLDPMFEQKILKNNAKSLTPMADDTSLDTLRGSITSSPSQKIAAINLPFTPTHRTSTTTTDSIHNTDERAVEAEKDDDFHDLDLKRIQPRYVKVINTSSSNLPAHRTSGSSLEQSIRRQERRMEEEERGLLHGSNSNLYEKELRRQADQEAFARKQHTNSQVSLVSRTSEDSCY